MPNAPLHRVSVSCGAIGVLVGVVNSVTNNDSVASGAYLAATALLAVALVVSASLTSIYMKLLQHHVLPLRRLKSQTILATGNATATSLLASPVLAQGSGVFTLLAVPLLGFTFYLILVLLTSLRETMRLRTAASSLSSLIAASTDAALNSPQAKQPASQDTAHALMACAVITLCALALAGSL